MIAPFLGKKGKVVSAELDGSNLPAQLVQTIAAWHPCLRVCDAERIVPSARIPTASIDVSAWTSETSLLEFDRTVHEAEDLARRKALEMVLKIRPTGRDERQLWTSSAQILTRYQRLFLRGNEGSNDRLFQRLFTRFVDLHRLEKPLVRADFDHAIDVWQWVLELQPDASAALQIAALFHDIERLSSEADERVEQHATDYKAFKRRHASEGAHWLLGELLDIGHPMPVSLRACDLVRRHEEPADDWELRCLNDADALSYFTLNSEGYLAYFGPEQTRKKVSYTLERMSDDARCRLHRARLPSPIRAFVEVWSGQP